MFKSKNTSKNRYSIRKFKSGAAAVMVATLFFTSPAFTMQAAEMEPAENATVNTLEKVDSDIDLKETKKEIEAPLEVEAEIESKDVVEPVQQVENKTEPATEVVDVQPVENTPSSDVVQEVEVVEEVEIEVTQPVAEPAEEMIEEIIEPTPIAEVEAVEEIVQEVNEQEPTVVENEPAEVVEEVATEREVTPTTEVAEPAPVEKEVEVAKETTAPEITKSEKVEEKAQVTAAKDLDVTKSSTVKAKADTPKKELPKYGDEGIRIYENSKVQNWKGGRLTEYSPGMKGHTNVTNDTVRDYVPVSILDNKQDFQQSHLKRINELRKKHGVKPLKLDQELSTFAYMRGLDMYLNNYFSHDKKGVGSITDQYKHMFGKDAKPLASDFGENIHMSYSSPGIYSEIEKAGFNGFFKSPGHYDNMIYDKYTHVGIGIINGGKGERHKVVQIFYIDDGKGGLKAYTANGKPISKDKIKPVEKPKQNDKKDSATKKPTKKPSSAKDKTVKQTTKKVDKSKSKTKVTNKSPKPTKSAKSTDSAKKKMVKQSVKKADKVKPKAKVAVNASKANKLTSAVKVVKTANVVNAAEVTDLDNKELVFETADNSVSKSPVTHFASNQSESSESDFNNAESTESVSKESAKSNSTTSENQENQSVESVSNELENTLPNTGTGINAWTIIGGILMLVLATTGIVLFNRKSKK